MKKAKMIGKKTLAVFLAVLMVLTAWVWVAPTEASAATMGNYDVTVKINLEDDDAVGGHIQVWYYPLKSDNSGFDTTQTNKEHTLVNSLKGVSGDKGYSDTIPGFPWRFEFKIDDTDLFDETYLRIDYIKVGTKEIVPSSIGDIENAVVYFDYDGTFTAFEENGTSGIKPDNNRVDGITGEGFTWDLPKPTGTYDIGAVAMTCPKSGTATQTVKINVNDQYGVPMYNPKWSVSGSACGTTGISVTSTTAASESTVISLTNAANNTSTTDTQTGTIVADWGTGKLSDTFTITDSYYTATFNYQIQNADNKTSSTKTEKREGYHGDSITAPTPPQYYDQDFLKTFSSWSPTYSSTITKDVTYTATYTEKFIDADYSAVNEAIAAVDATKAQWGNAYESRFTYTSRAAIAAAINAVVRGLGRTQQETVNGYADAINKALAALETNKYAVIFLDKNGAILLYEKNAEYESNITPPTFPEDQKVYYDSEKHYTYTGWDSEEYTSVVDDLVIQPVYNAEAHNFTKTENVPSDCNTKGATKYICDCGYSYTVDNGDYGDHVWDTEYTIDIQPTCTTAGQKSIYCKECGVQKDITVIPALGHQWGTVSSLAPATCDRDGINTRLCDACGVCEHTIVPAIGHNYKVETKAPTCTEKGYDEYICQNGCGHSYRDNYTENVAPHNYGDWVTVSEVRCGVAGVKKQTCNDCGYVNIGSIDALDHIETGLVTVIEATCTGKGYKENTCTVCNTILGTETIDTLGHNYVEKTVVAPTCTAKGYTFEECNRADCGAQRIVNETPALNHAWTSTTHAADCTHSAYIEHVCGNDASHNYVEYVNGSTALTHDFTGTETIIKDATCTEDGKKTVKCTRCDVTNEVIIPKLGHNYGEWDKTTNPATNDKDGTWTRECANCHNIETITIPKGGHNFVEDITKYVAPKCNAKGQRVYKCGAHENCIATVTVELDYAQHTIVKENKEATCTTAGYTKTYCSVCKEVFNSVDIPVKAHNYVAQDEVDATCTTSGYTPYKCENCTSTYNMYDENHHATGHVKWTEISRENATCTADGSVEYKCEKCTATKTEVLPKTGHNYTVTATTDATCEAAATKTYKCNNAGCGNTYVEYVSGTTDHTWSAWSTIQEATTNSYGIEKRVCSVCDVTEHKTTAPTGAHNFEKVGEEAATCTSEGYIDWECKTHTDCEADYRETLDKLPHKEKIAYTAPTCTAEGSTKIVCDTCTATIGEVYIIPAKGHAYNTSSVTTEPGCESTGTRTYRCSCGATITEEIPAKGHSFKTTVTDATCTSKGLVVTECTVCKKESAKTTIELAAKNHNWNDGVVTTPATCTNGGVKTYTCTICGETKTEDIDALGHNWGEWTVTPSTNNDTGSVSRECLRAGCNATESVEIPAGGHELVVDNDKSTDATCSAEGTLVYKCKNHTDCGITVTVTVPKTQHDLENVKTDAKCEENGSVITRCKECKATLVTTIIPAKGHSYTGTVTKEPSCTAEGEMTYTCAHDSTHIYTETIKKLPHTFESEETVAATCTTRGYEKYACSCGENYVKFTTDEAVGHSYKTVENSTTATCTEAGKLTLKCENCDSTIEADVPALGHDYVEIIEKATTATCKSPATKTFECSRQGCDDSYTIFVGEKTETHNYIDNWTVVNDATETSIGYKTRACTVCGQLEVAVIEATGEHKFTDGLLVDSKAATCTENGYEIRKCSKHDDCEKEATITIEALGHKEIISYTSATCTDTGSAKIICDTCKDTIGEEKIIPALGHTWDDGEVTTQPTCQTEGVMTFKCTVNGCNGTKTTAIAKNSNAHVYSVTTTEATCTTPATTVYKCACGDEKTVVTNFTLGHKWETEKTVEIPATCTSTGIKSTHCANCSETKDEETIPALNHTKKTEKIEATCTAAGYSAEVCDVCKTLLSSVVITEAKGHSWTTKTKAATCTDCATETKTCTVEGCGATETTITGKPTGHTWGDWTIVEGQDKKVRECTVDGCDATEECPIPTSGHNWNSGEEITAATCYEEGEMKYTCQGCDICTAAGTKATETIAIPKLAHAYIKVTTPATCETNGSAVVKCSVKDCGYEAATVTLPKIGHTLVRNVDGDKAATCNDIGWYAYKCNNLNCTYTEKIEVEALGHNYSTAAVETEQPTCTENGSKKYECSRCDAAIVTEIPALGHSFTETKVVAPTCTEKGYTIKFCSNDECGAKYVVADSFTDALGHSWSEWETVTPATNDADGLKKHICTVANCGAVEYAPIPMLGHQWNDGEVTTPATCETVGEKKYTCIKENCSVCNGTPATYTETIPATGHKMKEEKVKGNCLVPSYSEWTCENNCGHAYIIVTGEADGHDYKITAEEKATCEADGSISYECNDCHDKYVEIIPKLGHTYTTHEVKATCTTSGYTEYTCINDSKHTYKEFNAEPKGHSLGNWTVTLAPTDTVDGTKERSCSDCTYKETQIIPALIHNMVETENLAATCKNTGHITYKCDLTHEGYNKACEYSCTVTLPVVAHSLTTEKSAPSCDKEGYIRTICNNTGCDYKEETKTAALGHNWNDGEITSSTCQKQGNILYTCLRCGGTKTVKLELAQHTMIIDKEASKEATCTSRGYETYKCSVAGCSYGYSILGAEPTGHQNKKVETTPSTCKMSGLKKTICKDCNTILSVEVLSLAEHTYSSDVKAPTCTEMGYTIYTCGVCGDTYKDNYKSVVPHNFDEIITENVTIVDATCTVDGSKTVKCKDCDATDVTILPATGHINTSVVREESTCIKKGTEKVVCACGHIVSEKELPLAAHNYEMTYENGVYTYTCKVAECKHSYTETVETTFTVKFFAADKKTVLKTEAVKSGEAATAPAAPSKGADDDYHYTFSEWDRDFTEITSDLDVYPTYEKEAHYGGAATCTEKAVCDECGTGYGGTDASKHVIDTKLTPATCETDGVLEYYCTEDGCDYSKTEEIKKTGHRLGEWEKYQNGNCATPTIKIRKCRNNGCKYYEQKESYGSHTWYIQPEVAPTCTTVGYSEYKYCTTCGMEIDSVVIPKLNHRDNDGDGKCDFCAETETVAKCNCLCHSTGFMKLIYNFVRFFWIITKSQPTCNCGANHY